MNVQSIIGELYHTPLEDLRQLKGYTDALLTAMNETTLEDVRQLNEAIQDELNFRALADNTGSQKAYEDRAMMANQD